MVWGKTPPHHCIRASAGFCCLLLKRLHHMPSGELGRKSTCRVESWGEREREERVGEILQECSGRRGRRLEGSCQGVSRQECLATELPPASHWQEDVERSKVLTKGPVGFCLPLSLPLYRPLSQSLSLTHTLFLPPSLSLES